MNNPRCNDDHWQVSTLNYKPNNTFLCYLGEINVSKIEVTILDEEYYDGCYSWVV